MTHTFQSRVTPVTKVTLPEFRTERLYMEPVKTKRPVLPEQFSRWLPVVESLLDSSGVVCEEVYITIDEKVLQPGTAHRRPGAHIDGTWNPEIWAHKNPRPGNHVVDGIRDGYGGGLILVSNFEACRYWNGEFTGEPGQGGDMEHMRDQLDAAPSALMETNTAYLCNVWGIHESVPVQQCVKRSLLRIALPADAIIQ